METQDIELKSIDMIRDGHPAGPRMYNKAGQLIDLNLASQNLNQKHIEDELKKENLSELQALNLAVNDFHSLQLPDLPKLEYLDISENAKLAHISFTGDLPKLLRFDAYECALSELVIPHCPLLQTTMLFNNKLTQFPFQENTKYDELENVDLGDNQIKKIELWDGFPKLRYLNLYQNHLEKIDFNTAPPSLSTLDLRKNQLEELPESMGELSNLKDLYLYENPLSKLPDAIVIDDNEHRSSAKTVVDFFAAFKAKGSKANDRVKIIVVGNGRVGKTSMLRRLKGEAFNENEKFTHGVRLVELTEENIEYLKPDSLNAQVWDFGGQEIFYATHQFFMSDEALYIVAWTDKRNVEPYLEREKDELPPSRWRSIDYWLENIRHHSKDSPILLVRTHKDGYRQEINGAEYNKKFGTTSLDFSASQEMDSGLSTLKNEICTKLKIEIPAYKQNFPVVYDQLITAVENRKEAEPVISLQTFYVMAQQEGIEKGSEDSVLDYMRKTGTVIYFGDNEKLQDTVYINPNWLTEEVYKLINKDLEIRDGLIDQKYLNDTLKGYSPQQKETFIALLKQFELIFQPEEEENVYVAPLYLPEKIPYNVKGMYNSVKAKLKPDPAFVFRFPRFLPDNVMVNFISRYGPYAGKSYWKNGICFSNKQRQECIVNFHEEGNKPPCLDVYSSGTEEGKMLEREVCQAFVELSKNANAEISKDGEVFVSWQKLKLAYDNGVESIFDVEQEIPVRVRGYNYLIAEGGIDWIPSEKEGNISRGKSERSMEKSEKYLEEVKDLIGKAQLDKAIELLISQLPKSLHNEGLDVKSRYSKYRKEKRTGVLDSRDAEVRIARIRSTVFELIDEAKRINVKNEDIGSKGLVDEVAGEPASSSEKELRDLMGIVYAGNEDYGTIETGDLPQWNPIEEELKILFVAANPTNAGKMQTDVEYRKLKTELRIGLQRDKFSIAEPGLAVTKKDLMRAILNDPHIIHFAGHGLKEGIVITKEDNTSEVLKAESLRELIDQMDRKPPLVILNACYTYDVAQKISSLGIYVIGNRFAVPDKEALTFAEGFYLSLGEGKSWLRSFKQGRFLVKDTYDKNIHIMEIWYDGKKVKV